MFSHIYMHIYVFKIKKNINRNNEGGKKSDFGKNTWSLHEHRVPSYIIITSVKHHHHFNGDRESASSGTTQLEQANSRTNSPPPPPCTHGCTAEQKGTETLRGCLVEPLGWLCEGPHLGYSMSPRFTRPPPTQLVTVRTWRLFSCFTVLVPCVTSTPCSANTVFIFPCIKKNRNKKKNERAKFLWCCVEERSTTGRLRLFQVSSTVTGLGH